MNIYGHVVVVFMLKMDVLAAKGTYQTCTHPLYYPLVHLSNEPDIVFKTDVDLLKGSEFLDFVITHFVLTVC